LIILLYKKDIFSATLNDNYKKMDFLEKVLTVKKNILRWQEKNGDEFWYVPTEFGTENEETGEYTTTITEREHLQILDYLNGRWRIDKTTDKDGAIKIKVLPKIEPVIRAKTLELISRELSNYFPGTGILSLLRGLGVDRRLLIYPQTKRVIFYRVFRELAFSRNNKDRNLLFKIIVESIHPINLGGNLDLSEELRAKFDSYLSFDDLSIWNKDRQGVYEIQHELTAEEEAEMNEEIFSQAQAEWSEKLESLKQLDKSEKISLLRKTFQSFINVVEIYCENPSKPTAELNDIYQFLQRTILAILDELDLERFPQFITLGWFSPPFTSLFVAEKEYRIAKKELSWHKIRPELNATFGEIDKLYQEVSGSDILTEAGFQKKLNDIELNLSELNEKASETKEKKQASKNSKAYSVAPVTKIEITKLPKLKIEELKPNITTPQLRSRKDKLVFYPEDGKIEYRKEFGDTIKGNKDYALLLILSQNKNTIFNIQDIWQHCNSLVNKESHKFRKEKDIDDTIRQIRFKLKVPKGASFPISKEGEKDNKKWSWSEK